MTDWIFGVVFLVYILYSNHKEAKLTEKLNNVETKLEKAKQALKANDFPISHLEI